MRTPGPAELELARLAGLEWNEETGLYRPTAELVEKARGFNQYPEEIGDETVQRIVGATSQIVDAVAPKRMIPRRVDEQQEEVVSPEEIYAPIEHYAVPVDEINHPPHYLSPNGLGPVVEAIDVIEAFARNNYHRGNALKYLLRAGRKGDIVADLRKAIWYIEREIAKG